MNIGSYSDVFRYISVVFRFALRSGHLLYSVATASMRNFLLSLSVIGQRVKATGKTQPRTLLTLRAGDKVRE